MDETREVVGSADRTELDLAVRTIIVALTCILVMLLFHLQYDFYIQNGNEYFNTSDNDYYSNRINLNLDEHFSIGDVNNLPIIYLYQFLQYLTGAPAVRIAFVINISCLLLSYVMLEKVHFAATAKYIPLHLAAGLLPLVAYVPLINKDGITTLFYCSLVYFLYFGTNKSMVPVAISMLVRVQSPLVACLAWAQAAVSHDYRLRAALLFACYCAVSFTSAYLQSAGELLDMSTVTDSAFGLSQLRYDLDRDFHIGSFVTNFLLPMKYVYDIARSIYFDASPLSMSIAIGRIWILLLFARYIIIVIRLFYAPWTYSWRPMILVSSVVSSFLIVWMLSPVVHYRYFVSIIPIVILGLSLTKCTDADRIAHPALEQAGPKA